VQIDVHGWWLVSVSTITFTLYSVRDMFSVEIDSTWLNLTKSELSKSVLSSESAGLLSYGSRAHDSLCCAFVFALLRDRLTVALRAARITKWCHTSSAMGCGPCHFVHPTRRSVVFRDHSLRHRCQQPSRSVSKRRECCPKSCCPRSVCAQKKGWGRRPPVEPSRRRTVLQFEVSQNKDEHHEATAHASWWPIPSSTSGGGTTNRRRCRDAVANCSGVVDFWRKLCYFSIVGPQYSA